MRCNRDSPISVNSSTTPSPVLALVSKNSKPLSSAYAFASSRGTARCTPDASAPVAVAVSSSSSASSAGEETKSSLLPTSAMTMFGLAWRCSSLTQDLAFSKELCRRDGESQRAVLTGRSGTLMRSRLSSWGCAERLLRRKTL